jgi:phage terminase small subunit
MPRGRPKKSPREKLLEGSRVRTAIVEVFAPHGVPFIPDHLNDDAQSCARHIIANFSSKHISAIDSYVLSVFCSAWAWHKYASQVMAAPDFEPVIERVDKRGYARFIISPWFQILNEQARVMTMVGAKLYLTPADRHQLDNMGQDQPKSKFEGHFGTDPQRADNVIDFIERLIVPSGVGQGRDSDS